MKICELFESGKSHTVGEAFDPHGLYNVFDPRTKKISRVKNDDHLVAIIQQNCKIMLNAYQQTGRVLYRGIKGSDKVITTKIRLARKPMQMNRDSHDKLHNAFIELGLKATRRNSIFCTARWDIASVWGSVYVIFVLDGWEGTIFEKQKKDYSFFTMQHIGRGDDIDQMKKEIAKLKPKSFNSTADLVSILKSKYADIIITGDSYIAVNRDYFINNLAEKLGIEY